MQRREFLLGAASASAAVLWPWSRSAYSRDAPYPQMIQLTSRPLNLEAPVETYLHRVTPTELFYVRSHFDPPTLEPGQFNVKITGLVEKPLELSLAQLERMADTEVEAVLQCAGNGRALFEPRVGGVLWTRGAMSNGVWGGARLKDVVRAARPRPEAKHVILVGHDRPALASTPAFIRSVPIERALHEDSLIALRLNGKPLPRLNGGPARLVLPGYVADDWTKWVQELRFSETPATGFYFEKGYRFPDPPGQPGEKLPAERMKPLAEMNVKSVIATPHTDTVWSVGKPQDVVGVAFSGGAGIASVEVSVDGGHGYVRAELEKSPTPYGFTLFRYRHVPTTPGTLTVMARATDGNGAVQPPTPVWNPSGYLYNAMECVAVRVNA